MSGVVLLQQAASAGLGEYAGDLLRLLLSLAGVCALGYAGLRVLGKRGFGRGAGPVQVLQRVVLEPRRALYVVRAGERTLLLGCGETGAPALVADLTAEASQPLASVAETEAEPQAHRDGAVGLSSPLEVEP